MNEQIQSQSEFWVVIKIREQSMHTPSICVITFSFYIIANNVTELAREGALRELLWADELVLHSETIQGLMNKLKMESFRSKC